MLTGTQPAPPPFAVGSLGSEAEALWGIELPGPPQVCSSASTGCSRATGAALCAGATQHLRELAQLWRAHTEVITEIDRAQKSLITETDSCSLL